MEIRRHLRFLYCHTFLAIASTVALPLTGWTQSDTWSATAANGDWMTNANWNGGNVPGSGDTATFDSASTTTIIDIDGITLDQILIQTGAAAFTFGDSGPKVGTLTLDDNGSIIMETGVTNDQTVDANLLIENAILSNASDTSTLIVNGDVTGTSASAATLSIAGGDAITIDGIISNGSGGGTLALDVTANNTVLTLNGNNTFSGGFGATDTSGFFTVIVGHNNAFGTGTIQSQGIRFQSANDTINVGNDILVGPNNGGFRVDGGNDITFSGNISNGGVNRTYENSDGGTVFITGTLDMGGATTGLAEGNWDISGVISGVGGTLEMSGGDAAILTLSGANTYTGATELNSGTIIADAADVAMTSGALGVGGQIQFLGGTLQYTANSNGTDYSNRILNSTSAIRLNTNGQNITFSNPLAASNTGGLIKSGAGNLTLAGGNLYTGDTTISGGSIILTASESIANSSSLQINSGASIDLNGFTETIDGLSGAGSVTGGGTLIVGSAGGVISPGDAGTGTLAFDTNLTFDASSSLDFEYNGDGDRDLLTIAAGRTLTLAGALRFSELSSITAPFTLIDLADGTSTLIGTFSNFSEGSAIGGGNDIYTITYQGGADNNDVAAVLATNVKYWRGGASAGNIGWQVGGSGGNWYSDLAGTTETSIAGPGDIVAIHTTNLSQATLQLNAAAREVNSFIALAGATFSSNLFTIREGNETSNVTLTLTDAAGIQFLSDGNETGRTLLFDAAASNGNNGEADLFFAPGASGSSNILVQGSTDLIQISFDIDDHPTNNATSIIKSGAGELELLGPRANGYTGNWIVSEGDLTLDKNDNITAIAGDLTFAAGSGELTLASDGQFSNTSDVVFNGTRIVLQGGTENTVNSLFSNSGTIDFQGTSELQFLSNSQIDSAINVGTNAIFRTADGVNLTINGNTSNLGSADRIQYFVGASGLIEVNGEVNTGTGDGGLVKGGAGTLRLTNDGSGYGGVTQLDEGVTEFTSIANYDSESSLGDGNNDGTLSVIQIGSSASAATLRMIEVGDLNTSNRNFELGDMGGTIDIVESAQTLTLSGVFADRDTSGSLTKSGAGTLRLNGASTYTGNTTLSAAITEAGNNASFGTAGTIILTNTDTSLRIDDGITIANNIVIDDTGDNKVIQVNAGSATLSGTITTNETGTDGFLGNFDLEATNADDILTISGVITGGGVVNTTGNGTVVLTQANNFSGDFYLGDGGTSTLNTNNVGAREGFVQFSNGNAFGTGTIIARGSQLRAATSGLVISNTINLEGGALRLGGANDFEISGQITPIGSGRDIGHYGLTGTTYTLSGELNLTNEIRIRGSSAGGNGTVLITGDIIGSSQFATNTDFSGGNVILTGNNSYGTTNLAANTTLEIGNGGSTGTLGSGNVTNGGALVFNRDNDYTAPNIISGSGSVTQRGTGRTVLTGANTYSGATVVENGRLDIDGDLTMSNVTVNDGAALGGEGTITNSLTFGSLGSSNSFLFFDGTTTGELTVGTLDTQNGLTLEFTDGGGATSNLVDVITYTTWNNTADINDFTIGNTIQTSVRGVASVTDTGMGGPGTIQLNLPYAARTWDGDEANSTWWDIGTTTNWKEMPDELFQEADFVTFDDTASVGGGAGAVTVQLRSNVAPSSATFNNSSRAYTLSENAGGETLSTIGGVFFNGDAGVNVDVEIAGASSVFQTAGTTVLSRNNTYTGPTTLSAGTLQVGTGAMAGSVGTGEIVFDGGTIVINRSDSPTFTNNISGVGGTLSHTGSGTTILTGTNTSNSATSITGGTLQIGNGGAGGGVGGGDITVTDSTLAINTTTEIVHSGDFDFLGATNNLNILAGAHRFNGDGSLDVRGVTTWNVAAGASLTIGTNNNTNVGFNGNPTIILDGAGTGRLERTIASGDATGALIKNGTGTWTLARTSNENEGWSGGGLTINNGTIRAGANNVIPYNGGPGESKGNLTINSPGTFDAAGTTQNINGITGDGTYDNSSATASSLVIGHEDRDSSFSGVIQNSGGGALSVTKIGAGDLTLSGNSTYTGTTTVSAGNLIVNGDNSAATGNVTVEAAGSLGGAGTIGGASVSVLGNHFAGTQAPPSSGNPTVDDVSTQSLSGNVSYSGGASTISWDLIDNVGTRVSDLSGTPGTGTAPASKYDQYQITGNLDFSGATTLNLDFGDAVDWSDSIWDGYVEWDVLIAGAPIDTVDFNTNFSISAPATWEDGNGVLLNTARSDAFFDYKLSDDNTTVILTYAVPEPSTFTLIGLGLSGFVWLVRVRRRKRP